MEKDGGSPSKGKGQAWWSWLPFVGATLLFSALQRYCWPQIGDDSYIYFRYAERVSDGLLNWSDGAANIEGYSSPLWLGLLVVGIRLGVPIVFWAKALGVGMSALTFVGTAVLAYRVGANTAVAGCAAGTFALLAGPHFWAASGLETTFYSALFTWFAVALCQPGKRWIIPAMAIGVARPEGPAMVLFALGFVGLRDWRLPHPASIGLAILPALAWEGFRLLAYGVPLPNTYYAKASGGTIQLLPGLGYAFPALLATFVLWVGWRSLPKGPRTPLLLLGWVSSLLAVIIGGGGDWMWFDRLLVPVFPVLIAVAAPLWHQGLKARVYLIIALLFSYPASVPSVWVLGAIRGAQLPTIELQEGGMVEASERLAGWLRERYPDNTLVAVNHAGALPYYSRLDAIDMTGLSDAHIARVGGAVHEKYDPSYVLGQEPDLIVLNARVRPGVDQIWYHPGYWKGETALVEHVDFTSCYAPLDHFETWNWVATGENYILVYRRTCPTSRTAR